MLKTLEPKLCALIIAAQSGRRFNCEPCGKIRRYRKTCKTLASATIENVAAGFFFGWHQKFLSHGQKVSEAAKEKCILQWNPPGLFGPIVLFFANTYVGEAAVAFNFVKRHNRVCLTPKQNHRKKFQQTTNYALLCPPGLVQLDPGHTHIHISI